MGTKENIINKIKKARSFTNIDLPILQVNEQPNPRKKKEIFMNAVIEAGGKVLLGNKNISVHSFIPDNAIIIEGNKSQLTDDEIKKMAKGNQPIAAIFTSTLAVAENGATWLSDDDVGNRVLPFVSEHVIIFVKEYDIIWDMHQAYKKLEWNFGYGVFVAGPSKTADIEQNLVIGAHGPVKFTVVIYS